MNPIRGLGLTGPNLLEYNTSSGEITYNNTGKTFVIDHPIYEDKYLIHSCLEGPEAGVYYRGKGLIQNGDDLTTIELPDYVPYFVNDLTIHLTPTFDKTNTYNNRSRNLFAEDLENGKFNVYGKPGPFYWVVHGKRFSIDVEPLKNNVNVKGNGPYKWIA